MNDLEDLIEAAKQGDLERVRAILDARPDEEAGEDKFVNQRDGSGATALHYAAMNGHRPVVQLLHERGAAINSGDNKFGATPAGWAIEYIREMGGYLAIELDDLAHAIRTEDLHWVTRFLERFPGLIHGSDRDGRSFRQLAQESGNAGIMRLFEPGDDVGHISLK